VVPTSYPSLPLSLPFLPFCFLLQGTLSHLAPESLLHGHISSKSDVYAYGITLFELFTGGQAYQGVCAFMCMHVQVCRCACACARACTRMHACHSDGWHAACFVTSAYGWGNEVPGCPALCLFVCLPVCLQASLARWWGTRLLCRACGPPCPPSPLLTSWLSWRTAGTPTLTKGEAW
jgi:serine/threonine protein kinase